MPPRSTPPDSAAANVEARVAEWAEIGVPPADMAIVLGIPLATLRERFGELIARHDAIGRAALQRAFDKRFPDGMPDSSEERSPRRALPMPSHTN